MTETNVNTINSQIQDYLEKLKKAETDDEREALIEAIERLGNLSIKDDECQNKISKDLELIKVENKKAKLDLVGKIVGGVLGFSATVLAIIADKNGWFVSRLGLGQSGKKFM